MNTNFLAKLTTNENGEPKQLPVLGKFSVQKQYLILGSLVVTTATVAVFLLGGALSQAEILNKRIGAASQIQMLTQRIAKNTQKAIGGAAEAFNLNEEDIKSLDKLVSTLQEKNGELGKFDEGVVNSINTPIQETWGNAVESLKELSDGSKEIIALTTQAEALEKTAIDFGTEFDSLYIIMSQRENNVQRIGALQSLNTGMLRLSKNLALAANAPKVNLKTVSDLNSDLKSTQALLLGLTKGNPQFNFSPITDQGIAARVGVLNKQISEYHNTVKDIVSSIKKLEGGKNAGMEALPLLDFVYQKAIELKDISDKDAEAISNQKMIPYALLGASVLFIILFFIANSIDTRKRAWAANKEREETDDAVMRLMEELMPISEGNLAARSTVTEHVTGALADRINYMAEALQKAIQETRSASASVSSNMQMVRDLIQKAANLTHTADGAAKESHTSSTESMSLVKIAADKMEESRDKMQETSKRVKRLGEVSQSISGVADIIEELTEKTAILALNTQLKAAEAGEEGKTFRIIAEEIRKLSEESKKSLETIRISVQNMQSETKIVIQSIEQTTSNVVDSSRLWEQADASLVRIQEASKEIAQITDSLGKISTEQVTTADSAEQSMGELQEKVSHFTV